MHRLNRVPCRADHACVEKDHGVANQDGVAIRHGRSVSTGMFGMQKRRGWLVSGSDRWQLLRLAIAVPMAALVLGLGLLTGFGHLLLRGAAEGVDTDASTVLLVAAFGFLLVTAAVVAMQAARVAQRVAGPEYRLRQALQRIRSGDLAFRVTLRQGDLLGDLAGECNQLLDWLNQNPPAGSVTGTDVVELEQEPAAEPPAWRDVEVGA